MTTGIIRIVGSAVAALALAAPALAMPAPAEGDAGPLDLTASEGYDAAALHAMGARYEAMAAYYLDNDATFRLPEQSAWNPVGTEGSASISTPAFDDRVAPDGSQPQLHRSEPTQAFDDRVAPDGYQPQLREPEATTVSGTDDGFDWHIFGIATGSALLAAALGGTVLIATRTRGRVAHP